LLHHASSFLPVANASEGEHLVSADGAPVWPLQGSDDVAAVQRIAAVFRGNLAWIPASAGTAEPLSSEYVVALGADADAAASLHAHLTRRRCRIAESFDALVLTERPSVVVTTPEHLTAELLDWLYCQTRRSAPGVICGGRGVPLLRQVLVRAAAATICGPLTLARTEIFPTITASGLPEILGSEATAVERRQALAGQAGVLTIMTHSDGVDAFLGADLSVCARGRDPSGVGLSAAPRCALTEFCHRHEITVAQAVASGATFPADDIAARLLVWDVCFGVMPSGSVVDPAWGIGARLLDSAGIGAVLTTWQITLSSPAYAHQVTDAIASGVPAGVVVARFNASRKAREHHHRMCLLGDPRVRLPSLDVPERATTRTARPSPALAKTPNEIQQAASGVVVARFNASREAREHHHRMCLLGDPRVRLPSLDVSERATTRTAGPSPTLAKTPNEIQQAALLRLCMVDAKGNAPKGPRAAFAAQALDAIEAFEVAVTKGTPIADLDPSLGHKMRAAVLQYALAHGKLLENWIPFARSLRAATPTLCPVCRRRTDTLHVVMRPPGVTPRRLTLCPICGVLEDAPATSDVGFDLDGRTLRLCGEFPRERWTAAVLIGSSYPADSIQLMWPTLDDGAPAPFLELPPIWPPGPLRLSVFIMWDANFAVVSRMARDPSRPERTPVRHGPGTQS
jgi:hypothetical protein